MNTAKFPLLNHMLRDMTHLQGNSTFHSIEQRVAVLQNHSSKKTVNFSNSIRSSPKAVKRTLFYTVLAIEGYANRNVSGKARSAFFSKVSVVFRKVDLSPKQLKKLSVFFRYIFS